MSQYRDLECRTDLGEEFKQELLAKFDRIHRLIKGEQEDENSTQVHNQYRMVQQVRAHHRQRQERQLSRMPAHSGNRIQGKGAGMKAYLTHDGFLSILSECSLESYALGKWIEAQGKKEIEGKEYIETGHLLFANNETNLEIKEREARNADSK